MFRKRYRQQIPELNTTSTADISFMLLIFFLVTSSMDTDKGIMRQMAPPPQEQQQPHDINRELVMKVALDGHDRLTCNGKPVTPGELAKEVVALAAANRTGHIISIQADRETTYEAYFRMQDAIAGAYASLRQQYALSHYGHGYASSTKDEKAAAQEYYPQRISEELIAEEGGSR